MSGSGGRRAARGEEREGEERASHAPPCRAEAADDAIVLARAGDAPLGLPARPGAEVVADAVGVGRAVVRRRRRRVLGVEAVEEAPVLEPDVDGPCPAVAPQVAAGGAHRRAAGEGERPLLGVGEAVRGGLEARRAGEPPGAAGADVLDGPLQVPGAGE